MDFDSLGALRGTPMFEHIISLDEYNPNHMNAEAMGILLDRINASPKIIFIGSGRFCNRPRFKKK